MTMSTMTRRTLGAAAFGALIAVSATAAEAQTMAPPVTPVAPPPAAPPIRIRGTIEKVDGAILTIKPKSGDAVKVKLADNARITAMVKATVADIKPGDFIGVTAMPQPDGSQKAIGLHIFMDAQKTVVPHRFSPWDREPGSTMTNADVETTVAGVDGQTIMVKYPDGEKKVIVPPGTPVVRFVPGTKDDVKVGAQLIVIAATKEADGSLTAPAINVGRDGAAPPM
jgi:hypothetical protein